MENLRHSNRTHLSCSCFSQSICYVGGHRWLLLCIGRASHGDKQDRFQDRWSVSGAHGSCKDTGRTLLTQQVLSPCKSKTKMRKAGKQTKKKAAKCPKDPATKYNPLFAQVRRPPSRSQAARRGPGPCPHCPALSCGLAGAHRRFPGLPTLTRRPEEPGPARRPSGERVHPQ